MSTRRARSGSSRPISYLLCAFSAVQRAASAAVGHRQALRSAHRRGPDRPQLHPPDDLDRDRLLRQGQIQFQSVRRRRARSACASTNSTATISITARSASSAAAISAQVQTNGRPIETHAGAARYAGLGREMETGAARQLSEHDHCRRRCPWIAATAIATSISISIPTYKDRFGRPLMRITIDFHDNELKMSAYLTDKYAEILQGDGRQADRQEAAQSALRRDAISDVASLRRRDHGRPIRATAR